MTSITTAPATIGTPSVLTFAGVMNSEWIKLRSLRSTVWCYAIVAAITIAFGVLLAVIITTQGQGPVAGATATGTALNVSTLAVGFSQLVACVLGVLVISGEYGTGMIRSTFTAVPRRLPALFAKAIVFGVVTFVVALVSIGITTLVTTPILTSGGIDVDISDPGFLWALVGAAAYLALLGVMALSLGAIIRNSAGGIAAALGLVLVVPTVFTILGAITQAVWSVNLLAFLPDSAGSRLYSMGVETGVSDTGILTLGPLPGGLVLLGWVVVLFSIAAVLLKRRDV
jgi:ABC-2 type transport system permease protein